jgi:hypothetical protein
VKFSGGKPNTHWCAKQSVSNSIGENLFQLISHEFKFMTKIKKNKVREKRIHIGLKWDMNFELIKNYE